MAAERSDNPDDARRAAAEFGCDLSQIDYLLTLTPQQRLEHHELVRRALPALRAAGRKYLGFDPRPDQTPQRP